MADPPDNIGLGYDECKDKRSHDEYVQFLFNMVINSITVAPICWFSFNAKWTFEMGAIFQKVIYDSEFHAPRGGPKVLEGKACTQVFTFGQHRDTDLGNNHRPLWRLMRKGTPLYPEHIKVPSWRQRNGDKRAAPGGRVPGDVFDMQYPNVLSEALSILDSVEEGSASAAAETALAADLLRSNPLPGSVFDFPRVTGNSKQRCDWHPTQLHEELVERCIKLSTKEGDHVIDPFGGTGTTLRVCERINRSCTLIEMSEGYCNKIAEENGLTSRNAGHWEKELKKVA